MVGIDPNRVTIDEETDGWSAKGQITPPLTPEGKNHHNNQLSSCDVIIEKGQ